MSDTSPSLFSQLAGLSAKTRIIKLAPEDAIAETRRGPNGEIVAMGLKQDAPTIELEIQALTTTQRGTVDKLLESAVPERIIKTNADGSKVPIGYDTEEPKYVAKLEECQRQRQAAIALLGCKALYDSTSGSDLAQKITNLNETLSDRIVNFIAKAVWNFDIAGGEQADFFITSASSDSPS